MPRKKWASRSRQDFVILLAFLVAIAVLTIWLDLFEAFYELAVVRERWELDEALMVLAAASIGCLWFAARRWQDAVRARDRMATLIRDLDREVQNRRSAERSLRDQQSKLLASAKSARLGYFVWDLEARRCRYCSPEFASILGLTVEEYLTDYGTFDKNLELVHPDDREHFRAVMEKGGTFEIEMRALLLNGEVRTLRVVQHSVESREGRPWRSEGTLQDITDLKRAESNLLSAMNASDEAFALYGPDDRLIIANDLYRALYSTEVAAVVPGVRFETLIRAVALCEGVGRSDAERERWVTERLKRRQTKTSERLQYLYRGAWLEVRDVQLEDGSMFTLVSNVTEKRQIEERLRQAQRLEAVGQLTSGVAHDFNNLLGVIHGNAELLLDEDAATPELAAEILKASERGARLTHRLLAFSRKQHLRPQAVDLAALLSDLRPQLERSLGGGISLDTELPPGLWLLEVDAGQLQDAFLNLALNARAAMPEGGSVTVSALNRPQAESGAGGEERPADEVEILFSDTGQGMTAEVLQHAFEPFFTTDRKAQSSGLGLSMLYGFAEQSGGRVRLESRLGEGTTVHLSLPRALREASEAAPCAAPPARLEEQGRGKAVLVVDDNPPVRRMAAVLLTRMGYRVLEAADGAAAMAALEREPVDLALVDILLSDGMTGPKLVAGARERWPGLKVIYMSGYSAAVAENSGFLSGGARLLTKPFKRSELAEALQEALGEPAILEA